MISSLIKQKSWIIALILLVVCLIGYSGSLTHEFMMDDHVVLFGEKGVSNKSFVQIFTNYQFLFYRPVGHVFLWGSYRFFGTNVIGYHLLNLFLFVGICFLFYQITLKLSKDYLLAFVTSLLYALHPINSMLVNYVTANIISTYILTSQLAFLFFMAFYETKKKKDVVLSMVFFAASLFSHEMGMIFPGFLVCYLYFLKGEKSIRQLIQDCGPFILLVLGYFLFRNIIFSFTSYGSRFSILQVIFPYFKEYITVIMSLIYWYVGKLFWPEDIVFLWTCILSASHFRFEVYRFIMLTLTAYYVVFFKFKKGILAFALSFFIVGLLPLARASFSHFPLTEPLIEPHWFYFSSFGFFLFVAYCIVKLSERINFKIWVICVCLLCLGLLSALWNANKPWKDQKTYVAHWISLNEGNVTPFYWLGKSFLEEEKYEAAVLLLEKSIEIAHYKSGFIVADLGWAYFNIGQNELAFRSFLDAYKDDPEYSVTYYYHGRVLLSEGRLREARNFFNKAIALYPKDKRYHKYLNQVKMLEKEKING